MGSNGPDMVNFLEHLRDVQKRIQGLKAEGAMVFGLACAERQFAAYSRAAKGQPWARPHVLRAGLDAGWALAEHGIALPRETREACRDAIPDAANLDSEGKVVAFTAANSISDLLDALADGELAYGAFTAARAIDLLEVMLDAMGSSESAEAISQGEISRQRGDLDRLEGASGVVVSAVRRESEGVSVFGSEWFPDETG